MAFALLMAAAALFCPGQIMRLFTGDRAVIGQGMRYLRIVSVSYLFYTGTTITTCLLRAVGDVRIAMKLSLLSLCVNTGLNYLLIFGKCGMPRMGITGAATATLCARAVEFCALMWYINKQESRLHIRLGKLRTVKPGFASLYFKVCIPVTANELFWALGEAVIAMILGRMGREVVSANSIYAVVSELSGVTMSGMNAAAGVVVGQAIGRGEKSALTQIKRQFQGAAVAVGALAASIMLVCRGFLIDLYQVSGVTKQYASEMMLVGAAVEFFRSIQCMNLMGILRGAGDVRFAMWNDLLFLWLFTIPLGFMAGLVWKLPVLAVYTVLKLDQMLKVFTSGWRLGGTAWMKDLTGDRE